MTHYNTLGISPDASPDDIKHAFRRRAAAVHPDRMGGDDRAMAAVNRAYEVLSSPERKEQYDRTGTDAEVQSVEFQARDMLLQMISKVLESNSASILRELQTMLKMNRQGIHANQDAHKAKVRKLEKARGKVRVKKGDDLVEMLIAEQIKKCDEALRQMEQATAIMDAAELMLKDWEEDAPVPAYDGAHNAASDQGFNPYRNGLYANANPFGGF